MNRKQYLNCQTRNLVEIWMYYEMICRTSREKEST